MFNTAPTQFSCDKATFLKICIFARNGNVAALQHIFSKSVSVGLHNNEGMTPVMLLAREGNADAMWLLINKFKASINHAMQGAASDDRKELVAALLERGAHTHYALRGYSINGDVDNIEIILKKTPWYELIDARDVALQYLARYGHLIQMKELFLRWKQSISFDSDFDSQPAAVIQGLAYAGLDDEVVALKVALRNESPWFNLEREEMKGYAEAGRKDKVNKLLQSGDYSLKDSAITGYINAGLSTEALELVSKDVEEKIEIAEKSFIAGRFAAVGHVYQVEKILSEIGMKRLHSYYSDVLPFENAARGYCENGDITRGFDIITRFYPVDRVIKYDEDSVAYLELQHCISRICDVLRINHYLDNEKILIRTLALINHKWIREQVLDNASIYLSFLWSIGSERKHQILQQAEDIHALMKRDDTNFDQAMERIKCETTPALKVKLRVEP